MKLGIGIRIIILGLLSLVLTACFHDGANAPNNNDPNPDPGPSQTTGTISGQVMDGLTGQTVASATVSVAGQTTTTAADGSFTLTGIDPADRIIVDVTRGGFADQQKIVRLAGGGDTVNVSVRLLPIGVTQVFNPDTAQTVTDASSPASVALAAGALAQADGSAPVGDVTAEMTVIDPTVDIELMPGDMQADVGGGVLAPIESFGAITVNFADASGNELNLAQGSSATIRIPLADRSGNPPATIPLFFYDQTTGAWVEEGTATLVNDAAGDYYEGTVSHFSTWNADFLYEQITVTGCVQNALGEAVSGAEVVAVGDDYSGRSSAYTDASGNFSIIVKPNASVLISASKSGDTTNTVRLVTMGSDQAMDSCLVLSDSSGGAGDTGVSIKLTWGASPTDLDSYLVGPNNVRVYFANRGSLTGFPYAQLDVDDVTSFGPEVITIFNFPGAGTYVYSVHNFSGTFTPGITGSPARVELNNNGNVTIFTPPAGEGTTNYTWNVLEFVVADDGSFVVNPVNTWSASRP